MAGDADAELLTRLSQIEASLLDCVSDQSHLPAFVNDWEKLLSDLTNAIDSGSINVSTTSLASTLTDKISDTLASLAEIDNLSSQLEQATGAIRQVPAPVVAKTRPQPKYIPIAYDWLLRNIPNPYPSAQRREAIAKEGGASRKDVDNWFIDVRKRMGWNALKKKSFSNKKAEIVHAASIFFGKDDTGELRPEDELEFAAIASRTTELYRRKVNVDELLEESRRSVNTHPSGLDGPTSSKYPSPPLSPSTSIESISEATHKSRRKRAHSTAVGDVPEEPDVSRPCKRLRSAISNGTDPSFESSVIQTTSDSPPDDVPLSPTHDRRKKRAFQNDQTGNPEPSSSKRARLAAEESSFSSICSEPVSEFQFEDWFSQSFDAPHLPLGTGEDSLVSVELGTFEPWLIEAPRYNEIPSLFELPAIPFNQGLLNSEFLLNNESWEQFDSALPLPSYTAPVDVRMPDLMAHTNIIPTNGNLPIYSETTSSPIANPPDYTIPQHELNMSLLAQTHSTDVLPSVAASNTLPRHEKEWLLWQMKQATQRLEAELAAS